MGFLNQALQVVKAGDNVQLGVGVFSDPARATISGENNNFIQVIGKSPAQTIISGKFEILQLKIGSAAQKNMALREKKWVLEK